jgi:hypothetical protein
MALASKHLAVFQPHHARATTPRGTCTAAGGLDAETLRGFQLAGELFLMTSFFIASSGEFVGDGKRQRAVLVRNWWNLRHVESKDRC